MTQSETEVELRRSGTSFSRSVVIASVACSALAATVAAAGEWLRINPWPPEQGVTSVAMGNGRVVVGGASISTSDDGVVWRTAPGSTGVMSLAWTGKRFLAASFDRLLVSADGRSWQAEYFPHQDLWPYIDVKGVAERDDGAIVVAGARGDSMWVVRRDATGIWSFDERYPGFAVEDFLGADGVFVGVGEVRGGSSNGGAIVVSSDAEHWQLVELPIAGSSAFVDVEYCGGQFLALSERSVVGSSDGLTWFSVAEVPSDAEETRLTGIGCNNGRRTLFWEGMFETHQEAGSGPDAVPGSAPDQPIVVRDAVKMEGRWLLIDEVHDRLLAKVGSEFLWTLGSTTDVKTPTAVASNGATLMAAGSSLLSSRDGFAWNELRSLRDHVSRVVWTGSRWLVWNRAELLASDDGVQWRELSLPLEAVANDLDLASHDGALVAIGRSVSGDESHVLFSPDGDQWIDVHVPGLALPGGVCWTGSEYLIMGRDGFLATSADGRQWQRRVVDVSPAPEVVRVGVGEGVIVGLAERGVVVSSSDLESWSSIQLASEEAIWHRGSPLWTGRRFLISATQRHDATTEWIYASPAGVHWRVLPAPEWRILSAVAEQGDFVYAFVKGSETWRYSETPASQLARVERVVPVMVHASGDAGAEWRSDLQVVSGAAGFVPLFVAGASDAAAARPGSAYFQIPDRAQMWQPDPLGRVFRQSPPALPVRLAAEGAFAASSRIATSNERGSYGQRVPVIAAHEEIVDGEEVVLPLLAGGTRFRSNLGVANLGDEPVAVLFELFDQSGASLGTLQLEAEAGAWAQRNRVLRELGHGTVEAAYAVVSSFDAGARYYPYASVVDEATGDPSFVPPQRASGGDLLIPAAAHAPGMGGTLWRSDLDLVNCGSGAARVVLGILGGAANALEEIELAPGEMRRLHDVVARLGGAEGTVALTLKLIEGEVAAASRTFTIDAGGSYGQMVPAVPSEELFEPPGVWVLPGLEQSQTFRTNIGLVNAGPQTLHPTVELYLGDGFFIGEFKPELAPHSVFPLNRAFVHRWRASVQGYAIVRCGEPGLMAWASVVDQGTGDPVFHPAVAIPEP